MSATCRAKTPAGNGRTWACTRPAGHGDVHQAKGIEGIVWHDWVSGQWCRWPSARIAAALEELDDSTELSDAMQDELAEREHEHELRVNNGGVLP